MDTISKEKWLKLFKFRNISYDKFLDTYNVKYSQSIKS